MKEPPPLQKGKVTTIITMGIDLAKSIWAVHGVNENGQAELVKPQVFRYQLLPFSAHLPQPSARPDL